MKKIYEIFTDDDIESTGVFFTEEKSAKKFIKEALRWDKDEYESKKEAEEEGGFYYEIGNNSYYDLKVRCSTVYENVSEWEEGAKDRKINEAINSITERLDDEAIEILDKAGVLNKDKLK